ncbi:MAG: hypothetical protein ACREAA_06600 [Candidatus Polarisedimenticolia bacterium]
MNDPLLLLSQLHGEGRVTCRALQAAGFLTLRSVAGATVTEISDRAHLSARSAGRLRDGAHQLIEQGMEPDRISPATGRRNRRPARARKDSSPPAEPQEAIRSPGVLHEEAALLRGEEPPGGSPSKTAPRA